MKKKFLFLLSLMLLLTLFFEPLSTYAAQPIISIEYLENGYYFETTIEDTSSSRGSVPNIPADYITKTKTTKMKDSSGNVLWSVSITATFFYDGTTSRCTTCTPNATSNSSTWSIKSVSSSKNGNSATATAVAINTSSIGQERELTKSVTISCSPAGVVS